MVNAARQSFFVSAAICTLMAVLFAARYTLAPYPVEAPAEGGMPLAAMLTRFSVELPWIAASYAAIFVMWIALIVVQLTVRYAPAASRNYLSAQIFIAGAIGIVISGEALSALIAALLLALACRQFVFSFHRGYRFTAVFHAGFYMGLIPLLYAPAAVFALPVTIAALSVYRRSMREAIVCLAGLALPIPAAGFIHWAGGAQGRFIYDELWRCISERATQLSDVSYTAIAVAALIALLAVMGMIWLLVLGKSIRKTQYKLTQNTLLTLLFVAASAAVPGTSTSLMALVAVPCALAVTYAFNGKMAAVSSFVYCLILLAVFALNLLPLLGILAL
jgi:hypothetical protein